MKTLFGLARVRPGHLACRVPSASSAMINPLLFIHSTAQKYAQRLAHRGFKTSVALQYDRKKYNEWGVDDVFKWAVDVVELPSTLAENLRIQQIRGSDLPMLTQQAFERYGIPGGPAIRLVTAINQLTRPGALVFDSVEALVEWLVGLKDEKGLQKFPIRDLTSPHRPEQLASFSLKTLYGVVPRTAAIKRTLEHLVARNRYDDNKDPRQLNPLVATQAAPGTGKSFYLDQIAKLRPEDEVVKEANGTDLVKSWIPIPVSYNQFSPIYTDRAHDLSLSEGFAARMLFSYLMNLSSAKPETLYNPSFLPCVTPTLKSFGAAAPHKICDYFLADSKPFQKSSVLLLVDELLKVGPSAQVDFLSLIGELQDSYSIKLRSVITSLITSPLNDARAKSGRQILFVPLPLFSHEAVLSALDKFLDGVPKEKRLQFKVLVTDCAGHARTLEKLCRVWDSKTDFDSIQKEMLEAVAAPTEYHVELAIRGDRLPLRHALPPNSTIEDAIEAGFFINSAPKLGIHDIIPQLSLLQLRQFASENDDELLGSLVSIPTNPTDVPDWKRCETFYQKWELVSRRYLHCDSKTILGHYLRPSVSHRSASAFNWFKNDDLPVKMANLTFEPIDRQVKSDLASEEYTFDRLYVPPLNNPGFDYFYHAETVDGKPILVCVECKLSGPSAGTYLSEADISSKLALVAKALKPDVKDSQWKQRSLERVYVFFMAMRKVHQVTMKPIKTDTDNRIVGIVLDKERLLNLFGPSLFARPEFLVNYAESGARAH